MSECLSIIILAGGKGTRVKSVLGDIPKILAPIKKKFFLDYMLGWLHKNFNNINYELIIASGFGHDQIKNYCIEKNLSIKLSREKEPLGTLGAAANAAYSAMTDNILILNGDTIFECDLQKIFEDFLKLDSSLSVVQERLNNDRYGGYTIDKEGYLKLAVNNSSYISMGATYTKKDLLTNTYKKFKSKKGLFAMMDQDFISKVSTYPYILKEKNTFIDIGTLNSYEESQELVPLLVP